MPFFESLRASAAASVFLRGDCFLPAITAEDPEVAAEEAEKKLKSGPNSFDARFALRCFV